jgi:hypothetical protein
MPPIFMDRRLFHVLICRRKINHLSDKLDFRASLMFEKIHLCWLIDSLIDRYDRWFETLLEKLATSGTKLATLVTKLVTLGTKLATRVTKLATLVTKLVTPGTKLVTRVTKLVTRMPNFSFPCLVFPG